MFGFGFRGWCIVIMYSVYEFSAWNEFKFFILFSDPVKKLVSFPFFPKLTL